MEDRHSERERRLKTIASFGARLQLFSLHAMFLLIPFSKASVELGFGGLLLGWLMRQAAPSGPRLGVWTDRRLRATALGLIAFAAVCGLSVIGSTYPSHSIKGWIDKWLEYLLFVVLVADIEDLPKALPGLIVTLALSSVCVIVESLMQEKFKHGLFHWKPLATDNERKPLLPYGRMSGPYDNPIDLATYFMVVMPVFSCVALAVRRLWIRVALALLVAVQFLCFARTETFGAWVGLCAGLAAVAVAAANPRLRRIAGIVFAGFVLLAGVSLAATGRLHDALSLSEAGKTDRLAMWASAVKMIQARPILGLGVNTFMANYLDYWVGGEKVPHYAHNCFLQVTAETGFLGLFAFVGLLAAMARRVALGFRESTGLTRAVLLGLFTGLAAFCVQAAVDTNFYSLRQSGLFWVLSGVAVRLSLVPGIAASGGSSSNEGKPSFMGRPSSKQPHPQANASKLPVPG